MIQNITKKFARYERTFEILGIIAKVGTIMFIGVVAPNAAGQIIKLLNWVENYKERKQVQKALVSLEKRKLIKIWQKVGKGQITLTPEGRLHFVSLEAKRIKLRKGRWDHKWRLVSFDIPEKFRVNRRKFSNNLSFIGMCNLDKSVFVYPHECREEIYKIAELYGVKKYIRYITAIDIEPIQKLHTYFPYTRRVSD